MKNSEIEILLVEDDPNDVELAFIALRKSQLADKVQVARDGEEALEFLFCRGAFSGRSFGEPPKVIFLDLKLPKVNGLEVLREVKADARTRPIPIVILTSSKQQEDMTTAYQLGANSFIQKPIDFEHFQRVIKDLGYYWVSVNQPLPPEAFATKGVKSVA
jgi:CheY-like chemotaxis protein